MHRLSPVDMAFLYAERRYQRLHVGALCLFEPPSGAGEDFAAKIAHRLRNARDVAPPFDRRLESRMGLKNWVSSGHIELDQHFVHLSLPRPGNIRDLLGMVIWTAPIRCGACI